ncbi:methyltransferase domain-containing protein [Streptomyces daliensis]
MRAAFESVPREVFVPDRVWWPEKGPDGRYPLLDRTADGEGWAQAVYAPKTALITQIDDGAVSPDGPATGRFSSSISAPHMVLRCLGHLGLNPGERVLEIGTGTGYNTALLSVRAGVRQVTSVELDPVLATAGRDTLKRAGFEPRVVCADGEHGYPERSPFARVQSTAGVTSVPYSWVEQCFPGGVIVVPYRGVALLRLVVSEDGLEAEGGCVDTASFMVLRGQRRTGETAIDPLIAKTLKEADRWRGEGDMRELRDSLGAQFFLHLRVPSIRAEFGRETWWFYDLDGTSWAAWKPVGRGRQWGRRRLLDEVTNAFAQWCDAGQPGLTRFGVTVTSAQERVWVDEPSNTVGRAR